MADYAGLPATERGDAWGRYIGSSSFGALGAECGGWHHLQQAGFAEYDTAAAYALAAAKRAIDANPEDGLSP